MSANVLMSEENLNQDNELANYCMCRSCQDDVTLDWSDIMSFDELQDFVAHIKQLRCNIPEADQLFVS